MLLQKRDGIISDGDFIRDDDSSSLSDRRGRERGRSKNKAKLAVRNFLRRISKKSSNAEEDVSGIEILFALAPQLECHVAHNSLLATIGRV